MSLMRSGSVVAFFTLISRIFGYIRDIFIASYLGTNILAEVFTVAFRLPNIFRTLFAEGALSAAFVPIFTAKFSQEGRLSALEFANSVFSILLFILVCFVALLEIFMPIVLYGFAPGFHNDIEKFNLVVYLSYITTPYLIFISIASLLSGILNSVGRFAVAAALPILLNLIMIIFLVFLKNYFNTPAHALAYGTSIAGIVQLIIIIIAAKKYELMPKLVIPKLTKDIKTLFSKMLPIIFGSGVVQVNLWIGTIIASQVEGAIASLYFAERLNQFPLAIIGTALGTILLPTIAKQLKEEDGESKANYTINRSIEIALLLTLPCAVVLFAMGYPIIVSLFQRNAFTAEDSVNVANALEVLSIGLPAFVLIKALTPRFFASLETKIPVKISALSVLVNVILSVILVKEFAQVGIAFATSVSAWVNIILLYLVLHRKKYFIIDKLVIKKVSIILLSSFIMLIALYIMRYFLWSDINYVGVKGLLILLIELFFAGIIYLFVIFSLGCFKYRDLYFLFARNNG
jgi:putative peptidoglycan lipid II flippase